MHYKSILAEGFEVHDLLSRCLKQNVTLKNIRVPDNCEFTADVKGKDWQRFLQITGNRYRVIVTKEKGFKPLITHILSRRMTLVGSLIFLTVVLLQTSFISEIRVFGYEKLTEREILKQLQEAGLYVGCSRSVDIDRVEIKMYRDFEEISWIGIELKGGLAEVTIAERPEPVVTVKNDEPCNVVAIKEGYIEKVIAREGKTSVNKDDFVHVGDVVISGILEIEDKTYSRGKGGPLFRYVHAEGEVYAKTVYRFICYQESNALEKKKTGKTVPGIRVSVGNSTFNTAVMIAPYEISVYEEKKILDLLWPLPVEFAVNRVSELTLCRTKRNQEEIEKEANRQARDLIKRHLPESAQILNKGLKFLPGENIIKVTILIEALEQIGQKKSFISPGACSEKIIAGYYCLAPE